MTTCTKPCSAKSELWQSNTVPSRTTKGLLQTVDTKTAMSVNVGEAVSASFAGDVSPGVRLQIADTVGRLVHVYLHAYILYDHGCIRDRSHYRGLDLSAVVYTFSGMWFP